MKKRVDAPALRIVRIDAPEPATYEVVEGVNLNAATYFRLAD